MRNTFLLSAVALLASCAGSNAVRGPTSLKNADGGMWSSKAPNAVQACISSVQSNGSPTRVGEPLRFLVEPADPRKTRYTTVVSVIGDVSSNRQEAEAAASCL